MAGRPEMTSESLDTLADDLMVGADEIALFLFGDRNKRRKVYGLKPHLPLFNLAGQIAARKSTLRQYIAQQERAAAKAGGI